MENSRKYKFLYKNFLLHLIITYIGRQNNTEINKDLRGKKFLNPAKTFELHNDRRYNKEKQKKKGTYL